MAAEHTDKSFRISSSIWEETWIILKLYCSVVLQNLGIYFPTATASIYIGRLPNYSKLMAGSALARSFTEVSGTSIAWGINAALKTLIPQAIGDQKHDKNKLISVYFQRALLVNFIINIPITIIQIYAGSIMCDIDEPSDLCSIATKYCKALIPFLWFCAIFTSLQRVAQCIYLNNYIVIASVFPAMLSIPMNYTFVYTLNMGYLGTAYTVSICYGLSIIILVYALCKKGFSFMFRPLPLNIVCTYTGMKEFLSLALPNLVTTMSVWWSSELFILLSGYITNPDIAVSVSSILYGFDLNMNEFAYAINTTMSVRSGKYIGAQSWSYAKKSLICSLSLVLCITIFQAMIVVVFRRDIPLLWGTHDADIVYFASILLCVEAAKLVFGAIYHSMYGFFIGLGLPKYGAWLNISIMCGLNLCTLYIGLEIMGFKNNTLNGLLIVWLSPVVCRLLSALGLVIILCYKVDVNKVINKSLMRIEDTIRDYGTFGHDKKMREASMGFDRITEDF